MIGNDLVIQRTIAKGMEGKVKMAYSKKDDKYYAIKLDHNK